MYERCILGAARAARGRVGWKCDDAEVLSGVRAASGVRISKVSGHLCGVSCLIIWDRYKSRLRQLIIDGRFGTACVLFESGMCNPGGSRNRFWKPREWCCRVPVGFQ